MQLFFSISLPESFNSFSFPKGCEEEVKISPLSSAYLPFSLHGRIQQVFLRYRSNLHVLPSSLSLSLLYLLPSSTHPLMNSVSLSLTLDTSESRPRLLFALPNFQFLARRISAINPSASFNLPAFDPPLPLPRRPARPDISLFRISFTLSLPPPLVVNNTHKKVDFNVFFCFYCSNAGMSN